MIIECKHCGAPLDVTPQATFARCAYCGTSQRMKTARTQLPQTPQGWHPPQQWTPPQHFRAASVPLAYDQTKTVRKIIIIVVAVIIATTLLPVVFVALAFVGAFTCSSSRPRRSSPRSGQIDVSDDDDEATSSAICERAARCCRIASPGNTQHCDQMATLPDEGACRSALDGFVRAASAQGKSCD